jgi:hypothetical protein
MRAGLESRHFRDNLRSDKPLYSGDCINNRRDTLNRSYPFSGPTPLYRRLPSIHAYFVASEAYQRLLSVAVASCASSFNSLCDCYEELLDASLRAPVILGLFSSHSEFQGGFAMHRRHVRPTLLTVLERFFGIPDLLGRAIRAKGNSWRCKGNDQEAQSKRKILEAS